MEWLWYIFRFLMICMQTTSILEVWCTMAILTIAIIILKFLWYSNIVTIVVVVVDCCALCCFKRGPSRLLTEPQFTQRAAWISQVMRAQAHRTEGLGWHVQALARLFLGLVHLQFLVDCCLSPHFLWFFNIVARLRIHVCFLMGWILLSFQPYLEWWSLMTRIYIYNFI